MAHKKGVGSSRNGRDSNPKYLGVKRYGGEFVTAGSIIVIQRGTQFHPGKNVRRASNDSLFSVIDGHVKFEHQDKKPQQISVYPAAVKAAVKNQDGHGRQKTAKSGNRRPGPY